MNKILLKISLVGIIILTHLIPYIQTNIDPKFFIYISVFLGILPMIACFYFGVYLINLTNFYSIKRRIILLFEGLCIGFCLGI